MAIEPNEGQVLSNDLKGKKGLVRLWNALGYSREGLQATWEHEAAFREEVLLALVLVPLGLYLGHSGVEKALLVGSVLLVLIVEILNSALESIVDRVSLERHPLAKRTKDQGSAAVLLALAVTALVWGCILFV